MVTFVRFSGVRQVDPQSGGITMKTAVSCDRISGNPQITYGSGTRWNHPVNFEGVSHFPSLREASCLENHAEGGTRPVEEAGAPEQ